MAKTIAQLSTRVLQRLFVLTAGETADADDQALVIDAFNDWVNGLFADGLTPYADETATTPTALAEGTTYASSSNFPFLDRHFEGVAAILAVELAPDFEVDLRPSTVRMADNGWQRLRAAFILDAAWEMTLDRQLYRLPNRNSWSAVE